MSALPRGIVPLAAPLASPETLTWYVWACACARTFTERRAVAVFATFTEADAFVASQLTPARFAISKEG